MTFKKEGYYTLMAKAKDLVPGFREAFSQFEERVVLDRCSKSLITNYGRNVAHLALHFGRLPYEVTVEGVNSYLYHKSVHEGLPESYFKQTVFVMHYWFRLFGRDKLALKLPVIKKKRSCRYREGSKTKTMTLGVNEFLSCFCMHILPKDFGKIRHYGILASRNKPVLKQQQRKMGCLPEKPNEKDNSIISNKTNTEKLKVITEVKLKISVQANKNRIPIFQIPATIR